MGADVEAGPKFRTFDDSSEIGMKPRLAAVVLMSLTLTSTSMRGSNKLVQGADAVRLVEGDTDRRDSASAWMTQRGLRPWHADMLFAREPGDLLLGRPRCAERPVSGRRGVEAAAERAGEVRPLHSRRSPSKEPANPNKSRSERKRSCMLR